MEQPMIDIYYDYLNTVLEWLKKGDFRVVDQTCINYLNQWSMLLLQLRRQLGKYELKCLRAIIEICNIIYNNTNSDIMPIEDGIYDMLVTLHYKYCNKYPVGAPPIQFPEMNQVVVETESQELKIAIRKMDQAYLDTNLYLEDMFKYPPQTANDFFFSKIELRDKYISKKTRDTAHIYPKLAGTLDKCKFVLINDAYNADPNNINDPKISILERDFFQNHFAQNILNPNRIITMVAELKYDGVSIEAEIAGDTIISARSRGDTDNNIASDLTELFGGYKFPNASNIDSSEIFGMQFEAVISKDTLNTLSILRGKSYKNCRNAIIGLLGASDGYKYRDFITLVPLATSYDMDRIVEIEFMNKYYHSGEYLRYSVLKGNYYEILFQIKQFVSEAEHIREFIPIMYDGVVVSYCDQDLITALGRKNSVNKYSMAIKFNAMVKQTVFTHYTFSVGKNGIIVPLIHYKPIEFLGGIHQKSSAHSYARFKELNLAPGDIVNVEYTNDVMPYCTKANVEANYHNPNNPVMFPTECPICGDRLVMASDSAICTNMICPGRCLSRMVDMMKRLNLKDFSDETLRLLGINNFTQFYNIEMDYVYNILGYGALADKFMDRVNQIKTEPIKDWKIVGSLGFTNLAERKWKLILARIRLSGIINAPAYEIRNVVKSIHGLGAAAAETIIAERAFFMPDLMTISSMPNVIMTFGSRDDSGVIKIAFSGITNKKELADTLIKLGYDADPDAGVTKKCDILVVPSQNYSSTKTNKAKSNGHTVVMTVEELMNRIDKGLISTESI